jgi:hypothetical protein
MQIALFDPKGETAKLLDELGIAYRLVKDASELRKSSELRVASSESHHLPLETHHSLLATHPPILDHQSPPLVPQSSPLVPQFHTRDHVLQVNDQQFHTRDHVLRANVNRAGVFEDSAGVNENLDLVREDSRLLNAHQDFILANLKRVLENQNYILEYQKFGLRELPRGLAIPKLWFSLNKILVHEDQILLNATPGAVLYDDFAAFDGGHHGGIYHEVHEEHEGDLFATDFHGLNMDNINIDKKNPCSISAIRGQEEVPPAQQRSLRDLRDLRGENNNLRGETTLIGGQSLPPDDILIIGKDALDLAGDGFDLSGVPDGLKVIVFEQSARTLEKRLGFRTAEYGLRQVFPRVAGHPLLANITADNLRDWRGDATLLPPRLDYATDEQVFNGAPTVEWCGITVPRVWRCGNRGSVASVLIEKPACGDFLPILDGGFSLQYSPLMEYRHGSGMILFCQMDVTGRTENDPAAIHLVANMLRYVRDWKAEPRRQVLYVGDEEGMKHLERMGVSYTHVFLNADPDLGWEGNFQPSRNTDYLAILAPGQKSSGTWTGRTSFLNVNSIGEEKLSIHSVLSIGLNQEDLKIAFPDITTQTAEHISTYFEPFGNDSPLRGIGPADLHNRDPKDYPLVTGGAEIIGNGILAVADGGRTVICGLAPWQFPADKQSFKRTFRRSAFTLSRLLGNMNADLRTPLPTRFHGQVAPDEKRWLDGLYLDTPEEWDDPYRFFRW